MIIPFVDDCVNVTILQSSCFWVCGYVCCIFGNLKPTPIERLHVLFTDGFSLSADCIHQYDLHFIAFTIRLFHKHLPFFPHPNNLCYESIVVGEVVLDRQGEAVVLVEIVKLQLHHRIWRSGFRILDLSDLGIILFARLRFLATRSAQKILNRKLRYEALVGLEIGNVPAILTPPCRAPAGKDLFFVNPIRHSVK